MEQRRGPVTEYPKPCLGPCKRTLRPSRSSAQDYPDTVQLSGLGRCRTCRDAIGRNGQAREAQDTKTVEQNRAGVEAWLKTHWRPSNRVKVVQR